MRSPWSRSLKVFSFDEILSRRHQRSGFEWSKISGNFAWGNAIWTFLVQGSLKRGGQIKAAMSKFIRIDLARGHLGRVFASFLEQNLLKRSWFQHNLLIVPPWACTKLENLACHQLGRQKNKSSSIHNTLIEHQPFFNASTKGRYSLLINTN